MTRPSESYLKVQYDLRPAKQAERRMLIDAFQLLAAAHFPIREYKYIGMGSIYFVDFILFHRLLGIHNMLSVEYSQKVRKRVKFNRPFDCIDIEMGSIGDVIPQLDRDLRHLLWLDYDQVLTRSMLHDVTAAAAYLSVGSILLITVDAEPPGPDASGPKEWREHFVSEAREYVDPNAKVETFAQSALPAMNVGVLHRAIKAGLAGRREVEFVPLFNFMYSDGHQMLTMGGMICGGPEKRQILGSALPRTSYARLNLTEPPYHIKVPRLTRKERLYLDAAMPCSKKWRPREFELSGEDIENYLNVYRFLPAYAELLL